MSLSRILYMTCVNGFSIPWINKPIGKSKKSYSGYLWTSTGVI